MKPESILNLIFWFQNNRTDHFFRTHRNVYATWISEIALQQTRLAAALPPLQKFLDCFPDLQSLAVANEEQVVQCWQGLGYYNRARNLHKAARYITENHSGSFPNSVEELKKVPGIGDYTAAAIASIHFDVKVPVIDGNVKRIFSRLHRLDYNPAPEKLRDILTHIINHVQEPGEFNEAIMEFGQKICLPSSPACPSCFLQEECIAFRENVTAAFPPKIKKEKTAVAWDIYLFTRDKSHIGIIRIPEDFPFLRGHMGFPGYLTIKDNTFSIGIDMDVQPKAKLSGNFKHTIMHYLISASVFVVPADSLSTLPDEILFIPIAQLGATFPSSFMLKAAAFLN